LKAAELRALTDEELAEKLGEGRQELFKIRFQAATGALDSSARLRRARREIARILTIQNERRAGTVGHG
jgi:large subunit ribosomal protein L29